MNTEAPRTEIAFQARHLLADFRSRLGWPRFVEFFTSLGTIILFGTLSYFFVSHFIVQSLTVSGRSMYPTLMDNGNYWLNHLAYLNHEPRRTDIVAVQDPNDGLLIVKRIIALPGESIYLNHGRVYVNGKLLEENYLPEGTPTYAYEKSENEFFIVGRDQFFVMGDNRNNSTDSRTFGPVSRADILGKIMN